MREQRRMRVYNILQGLVAIWNKRSQQHELFNQENKEESALWKVEKKLSSGHQSKELASSILYTAALIEGTWKISYCQLFDTKYTYRDLLHWEEQNSAIIVGGHCEIDLRHGIQRARYRNCSFVCMEIYFTLKPVSSCVSLFYCLKQTKSRTEQPIIRFFFSFSPTYSRTRPLHLETLPGRRKTREFFQVRDT